MLEALASAVQSAREKGERFNAIREFYREASREILNAPRDEWAIDPYTVDWSHLFTPIESGLWIDIRCNGVVLYPQYPIGRYFVDFANPVAKVAIECDGARWHQYTARDEARQAEIERMGWRVYRFTGRECLEPDEIYDDEQEQFVPNPKRAGPTLRSIAQTHRIAK